jgi:hypothetical protein
MKGERIYEYEFDILGVTDYGVGMDAIFAGKELFVHVGVPTRGINAEPPLSERTNMGENRKFSDYDAILVSDSGHFILLRGPRNSMKIFFAGTRALTK